MDLGLPPWRLHQSVLWVLGWGAGWLWIHGKEKGTGLAQLVPFLQASTPC